MNKWIKAKLGDIGTFSTSSVDKKYNANEQAVYLVNYMDVYRNNTIDSSIEFMEVTASKAEISRSKVALGDVLFTPSSETPDDIGHSAVVAESLANTLHSYHTVRFRPHDQDTIDLKFAAWFCHANDIRKQFEKKCAGSTRYTLSIPSFRSVDVEIPESIDVQRKIADCLDTIDQTIEKTEALIKKYQQIKAGLMHDLFTRGIGADGKLRPPREHAPELYKQTSIGWIPKEWEPLKLKDILKNSCGYLQTGPFGSQLHSHEYQHEGIPLVMPQDVNDGKIDEIQIARITEKRAQSLLKHRLKIGDIIIARRGELSRAAAITNIECGWVCGTGCFLLRLGGSNLDARFFSMTYRHPIIQRQVEGLAVGSTMPSLNNEIMGKLIFPYMGKNEQTAIADRVQISERRITALKRVLDKLKKQKSGLLHDLLTGQVSVNVEQAEEAHV